MKAVVISSLALATCLAGAQVIDFETLPDGVTLPQDDQVLPLGAAYQVESISVAFGFDTDSNSIADTPAHFEQQGGIRGQEDGGFVHCADASTGGVLLNDFADPNFIDDLGTFMLRSPVPFGLNWRFVIDYSEPVFTASGQIWDIENSLGGQFEQWEVTAFHDNSPVASVSSPSSFADQGPCSAFDGEPWPFVLGHNNGFTKIVIRYIGTQISPGFVFDQFRATSTIPGPLLLNYEPGFPIRNASGISHAQLNWSEPVKISSSDITVFSAGTTPQPVAFTTEGTGTTTTNIVFTGEPGGVDTGAPVPLVGGAYEITILDTARASDDNAPIDGDSDGVAGGAVEFTVTHFCHADVNGDGVLDNGDIGAFVAAFLASDIGADFNADGFLDNGDIGAFVAAFLAGC